MTSKCVTGYAMSVPLSLSLRLGSHVMRCVRPGVAALGHVREAREEVIPALGVRRERALRQVAVHQAQARSLAHRFEVDFDGARAGWHDRAALPAPGEYHSAIRHDLDEFAVDGALVFGEIDAEVAAGPRLEVRELALPADVLVRVGQQPEDGLRPRGDGDDLLNCLCVYGHDGSPFVLPAPPPASGGAGSRPSRTQGMRAAARCFRAAPGTGVWCRSVARSRGPPPSARAGAARSLDGSRRSGWRSRRRRARRSRPDEGSPGGGARRWHGWRLPPAHVSTGLRKCQVTYRALPGTPFHNPSET